MQMSIRLREVYLNAGIKEPDAAAVFKRDASLLSVSQVLNESMFGLPWPTWYHDHA